MDCPVCLKKVEDYIKTKCNHFFCKICLDKWLDIKNTCPMCREELKDKNKLKRTYMDALLGFNRVVDIYTEMFMMGEITIEELGARYESMYGRMIRAVHKHYERMEAGRNKYKFIKI